MTKKLLFDTLSYAKLLGDEGVSHADIHSMALAEVLSHNLYSKSEINEMLEATLKRVETQIIELRHELKLEVKDVENRFEKALLRNTVTVISVLGALIVIVGAVSTFIHAV